MEARYSKSVSMAGKAIVKPDKEPPFPRRGLSSLHLQFLYGLEICSSVFATAISISFHFSRGVRKLDVEPFRIPHAESCRGERTRIDSCAYGRRAVMGKT